MFEMHAIVRVDSLKWAVDDISPAQHSRIGEEKITYGQPNRHIFCKVQDPESMEP